LNFMDVSLNLLYASNVENRDIKKVNRGFLGKAKPQSFKSD